MADTPEEQTPRFTLPEWGTSGAPSLPIDLPADEPVDTTRSEQAPAVLSTGRAATTSTGVIVAAATVEGDGEQIAERAANLALDRLARAAITRGAATVVDVRLELAVKGGHTTVIAYGSTGG